jgi:NADH-quinone oxidoreductase subunit N
VNFSETVSQLLVNTRGTAGAGVLSIACDSSIALFLPEIALCLAIVLLLVSRMFTHGRGHDAFLVAFCGAVVALVLASVLAPQFQHRVELFTGMLVYDSFSVFLRSLLLLFVVLFVVFTRLSGIPDRADGADIYTLILGATLGMCLMVSANHLLMVFLAVEMASVPSYALAGLMKGRPEASEAALKYAVYGGATAGVMLYGISLLAGLSNSAHLPTIASELAARLPTMPGDELMVLVLGSLMIMVGLAFKVSAVPFHFWCPDVFEGATAEVNAFLSVASKAAALGLLVRVAIGLTTIAPPTWHAGRAGAGVVDRLPAPQVAAQGYFSVTRAGDNPVGATSGSGGERTPSQALAPARDFLGKLVALLAVITCTFGNLAAYGQTNMKRLLAYSTIAHAGYMLMAVPPMLVLAEAHPSAAQNAVAGLALYLAVYLFLNLGAFATVAFLRNATGSEQIADYGGLIRHCPVVVVCLALMLFGLVGVPPLSGFIGKVAVFASLAEGFRLMGQGYLLLLLVIGCLNTVLSLFYYLRVVKVMTMDPDPAARGPLALSLGTPPGMFLFAVTVPTAVLITCWGFLDQLALGAARQLLQ